jgi:hypothetical protein
MTGAFAFIVQAMFRKLHGKPVVGRLVQTRNEPLNQLPSQQFKVGALNDIVGIYCQIATCAPVFTKNTQFDSTWQPKILNVLFAFITQNSTLVWTKLKSNPKN